MDHLKTPTKPSEIPRFSSSSDSKQRLRSPKEKREVDENDLMGSNPQSSKKPSSMTKNFMSPTVSAASKVTTPRKKILAERNEAFGSTFSDTHLPKRSTHASADLVSTPIRRSHPRVSESDDEEGTGGSLSQPYDPLTNYLSPRPQFLRYNPNRRLEILHRRESGGEDGNGDGLSAIDAASIESEKLVDDTDASLDADADGSSSSSSQDESVKEKDGSFSSDQCLLKNPSENEEACETDDEDDEEEELEEVEAKHGYFYKSLKFLMLLLVLALSTLYVSSMNSPTPPPPLQASREFNKEYFKTQESFVIWGSSFFDQSHEKTHDLFTELIEKEVVIEEEMKEELGVSSGSETDDGFMEETETVEEEWRQVDEVVVEEEVEVVEEMSEEVPDQVDDHLELNEKEEPSEISQVSQIQMPSVSDSDQVDEILVLNELESTSEVSENHIPIDLMEEEVHVVGEKAIDFETSEVISEAEVVMVVQSIAHCEEEMVEDEMEETKTAEVPESLEVVPPETNINKVLKFLSEAMETDFIVKLGIGVSLLVAFLVSMVLGFFRTRKPSAKDCSSTFRKPSFESRAVENNGYKSVHRKEEETIVANKKFEKVAESYISPCSSVLSGGKYLKESSRIQGPSVELLGEYVVEELNSSFRSCSLKPKTVVECEESHFSASQEKQPRRKAVSSPVNREYSSLSGLSATESPSYGSFTVHETIVKKEELITTPVRRSSRLRSKSVMSP